MRKSNESPVGLATGAEANGRSTPVLYASRCRRTFTLFEPGHRLIVPFGGHLRQRSHASFVDRRVHRQ